jgi:hypothetical protein
LIAQRVAEADVRICIVAFEREGSGELRSGFAHACERNQREPEVVMALRQRRAARDCLGDQGNRYLMLTTLVRDHTEQVKAVCVIGIASKNLPIDGGSSGSFAHGAAGREICAGR